jgi:ssDNA-binding replication factor A large subunit
MVEANKKTALTKPVFIKMDKLEPGTRVNMHVKVDSVKIIRQRKRYEGGTIHRVAECVVGDEHGSVKLMAYDD